MLHPEEQSTQETVGKKGSILMAVLLFVAIAAIAAFGYMRSQGIELENIDIRQLMVVNDGVRLLNETSKILEIPYNAKERPVFGVHMDYIVKCSPDGIWFLDKNGREQWSPGAVLANPVVKSNGKELLVADIGGRDFLIVNGKNVRWKGKTEENILNVEISKDGFVTVLTSSKLYNGEIRVYDSNGIERFQSTIANNFAVTAKIAPSGKLMATSLINASDTKAFSCLKLQDINGAELNEEVNMPRGNGIYPFIWFSSDDSIFAAGDTSIIHMGKNGNIIWDKQFRKIVSACPSSKHIAAAVKNEDIYELKVYTTNGEEYSSAELEGEVRNISSSGGIIAVNSGMSAAFFTEKGNTKGIYNSRDEIIEVLFFNKQQAAVITKSYIAIVDI